MRSMVEGVCRERRAWIASPSTTLRAVPLPTSGEDAFILTTYRVNVRPYDINDRTENPPYVLP